MRRVGGREGTKEDVRYVAVSGDIVHCSFAFHLEDHFDGGLVGRWGLRLLEKVLSTMVGME